MYSMLHFCLWRVLADECWVLAPRVLRGQWDSGLGVCRSRGNSQPQTWQGRNKANLHPPYVCCSCFLGMDIRLFQTLEITAIRVGHRILTKWKGGSGVPWERNWIGFSLLLKAPLRLSMKPLLLLQGKNDCFFSLFATMNVELLRLHFGEFTQLGANLKQRHCEGPPSGFPISEPLSEGNYTASKGHIKQKQIPSQLYLLGKVNG